ncbi:PREDICTED: uncharacterized protein LOC109473387 [Branchiostoma belcheri]|uniref:1-alkyl-2-acetylglycerophosphocholine esterase n=1 Tax=Branchiostoma belcheri TaxID=7741 RepID=A0A6P4ZGL8_BRABE|nr:PREDICTED: uncharacterized protein LOC109473387 [Branchiostoma belcheri]
MDMSESVEEESTAPKAAVMKERAEEKQEEEWSIDDQHEGTVRIKKVVIFSDSLAKYTQQYLSSHEFSYRVVAQRGAQIHDVTHNVKEFSASDLDNPTNDVVVLHVGTNNLCNNQTLDQNIQDYEELLQSAVNRFPNAGILVSGILPRFDSKVLNDAAKMYNILLAQLSHTFADKVKFVDLGSHFRSDRFFAIDGLHLSYQGNPRFAAKLQEAVEYHFSTDPEHVRWKEAFSAAVQKVPFPKPSLLGPVSSGNVEKASQREVKPRVPVTRKGFKSLRQKVKESTRSRRKFGTPKQEKKCSDVSYWTGWTRCQGPTAACSPSGNGPKWKTEYLIRTNCCLYKRLQKAPHSHQPKCNTKRGKKRKMPGPAKVDPNPKDLDKLEELLEECAGQSALWRNPGPIPRKRKRQCSGKGELLQDRKNKDHRVQQKDINPQPTCTNDGHNTADLHDDRCPSYPVYIQMWDGQLLTGDIADDSTVKELHETVAKFYQNGLPKEASFYRGGLKVTEEVSLKHQGIVAESTVQVLLKLKGGGDKGDAEAKAVRHMTEWTEEEAVQWMQTEAKMRPDEVKPLVEEQVDGLALWEMTVDSLKKHFSCLSGGAKIKLLKALKSYRKMSPDFEQIILPESVELPSNVTSWREKEIRLWLSCVVKFTQNDIDSVCALGLDGDSLLKLDEETVRELEFLPEMKQGPLVKLLSCVKKLNHLLSERNLAVEDVKGGKEVAEIPLITPAV